MKQDFGLCVNLVVKPHSQLPRGQLGPLERKLDGLVVDGRRDAIPHPAARRRSLIKLMVAARAVSPATEAQAGRAYQTAVFP